MVKSLQLPVVLYATVDVHVCVCMCVFVCDVTDADLLCHFLMGSEAMKVHYTVAFLLKEPLCKGHCLLLRTVFEAPTDLYLLIQCNFLIVFVVVRFQWSQTKVPLYVCIFEVWDFQG